MPGVARQFRFAPVRRRWCDHQASVSLSSQQARVTAAGASVSSWDIWSGGIRTFQLPRSTVQDVDKLLGKRGTPSDRHTLRLSTKCCAWDVTTAMTQWVLGGILGYGPLLGLPSPADLHREDAALHRLDVFPQLPLLVILLLASGQVPRSRLVRDSIVWGEETLSISRAENPVLGLLAPGPQNLSQSLFWAPLPDLMPSGLRAP